MKRAQELLDLIKSTDPLMQEELNQLIQSRSNPKLGDFIVYCEEPGVDYEQHMRELEKKYNITVRDYARTHPQFGEWCDKKGYGQIDPEGKHRGSSQVWFKQFNEDESEIKRPYQDFWHWMLEYVLDQVNFFNGAVIELSWPEVLTHAEAQNFDNEWVREIIRLLIQEHGTERIKYDFSW
jgi:hypothetical protein